MNTFQFVPQGVCARQLQFSLDEEGNVHGVSFYGGCNGNLKAISKLVDGWKADEIISKLAGNTCGFKQTSCADQLSLALADAKAKSL